MRRAARHSVVFAGLSAVFLLSAGAASAALQPGRPPLSNGTPAAYSAVLAEAEFTCGTYRNDQNHLRQQQALHLHNQKQIQEGRKKTSSLGLDYVYEDVWIIEDDGSLTLSGTNAFDTNAQTHEYVKSGTVYTVSSITLSYDATLGNAISPGDDGAVLVTLPFAFPIGGGNYTQMYVSGNGAVAFGAVLNPAGYYDNADFFSTTPKIAPYYLDLDVTSGGTIRVKSEASKYTVTWSAVPEYGTATINTVQLVLYPTGKFRITYNGIGSTTQSNGSPIITGFHPGGANPPLEEIAYSADLPHVSAAGAAVYEQYFSYANPVVDEVALFKRFYQQFPDDFFQLVFFTNFTQTMAGFANELNIKNDVTGIGLGLFDGSGQYGSNGVLESRCNMNRLGVWNADPTARVHGKGNNFLTIMGQEAGHRWGAFMFFEDPNTFLSSDLMLGRSNAHWSYYCDVDHSSLEGGNWQNTGGNNWVCPSQIDYFSEVDEYTFGLRTPEEVKDMFLVRSASNDLSANRSVGTPTQNAIATGTFQAVTIEDIINYEGARTPAEPDENKDLRQGFIYLVQQGSVPGGVELAKIAGFRSAWESYFERACDGRLTCNTSITQTYEAAVIRGYVRNRYTTQIIPEFTARSLERSFNQHVAGGGRFFFRYLDGPGQGTSETVTLVFEANGYYPDTLVTTATYGVEKVLNPTDVLLTPIASAAGDATPRATELFANHPNPFNPSTTIRYVLGVAGRVRLAVYDAAGRHVRTLVSATEAAGEHAVDFDGRDNRGAALASGVYFYRLEAGNVTQTRKMVLLK